MITVSKSSEQLLKKRKNEKKYTLSLEKKKNAVSRVKLARLG